MIKRTLFLVLTPIMAILTILPAAPAEAAAVTGFNAGNIMDDSVFTRYGSMSASQIKTFLNKKGSSCTTGNCLKNYTQSGKSSARIIYEAARDYKINPQVLIVLLQKETGLVTINNPASWRYRTATGYGCPDGGSCDADYYGFTNQVRQAAKMFRYIMNRNPNWYTPYTIGSNRIYWHPDLSRCGSSTVSIQNLTTVALYSYTPYRPNQAALNAGYGEGNSCSSYGNRNFYQYFKDWFGSVRGRPNNIRLITCSGNPYMVERFRAIKRRITDTAMETWQLEDKIFSENDGGCSYPTYDAQLNRLIRSRKTGNLYVVDKGKYYYIPSQTIASAWGFGSISQAVPQFDSYSITDNLDGAGNLPRLTTSDNLSVSTYYLIDGGTRYAIAGTSSGDTTSLQLVRGYKEVPAARLSVGLIQTLNSSGTSLDYSFKIGENWYLLNHNQTRRVYSSVRSIWDDFISGPTLSSGALSIFGENLSIGNGFYRSGYYYRVVSGGNVERTANLSIAQNWVSHPSPRITQLLTNKILGDTSISSSYTTHTSGNIRLISCGDNKYLVERYISKKRPVTAAGLEAWGLSDGYVYTNDSGCNYPSYGVTADKVIRSRDSGKVYYLDGATAYYAQSQEAADAWELGDLETGRFPQFTSESILDYLDIVRELPPPPLP